MKLPGAASTWPRIRLAAVAAVTALCVVVLVRVTGVRGDIEATLLDMGFDPGRSILLTAYVIGAFAAWAVVGLTNAFWPAVLLGAFAVLANDADAFWTQTLAAIHARGTAGTFDSLGWALTVLTLVVSGTIVAWAAALLAESVRRNVLIAGGLLAGLVRTRTITRANAGPPLALLAIVAVVLVTVPVLGDMLNYSTDVRMLDGGAPVVGLFGGSLDMGGGDSSDNAGAASPSPSSTSPSPQGPGSTGGAGLRKGPLPGWLSTPGIFSTARPWSTDVPTGTGRDATYWLPGPWAAPDQAQVDVHLPPGYDSQSSRRYPVLYEMPYRHDLWQGGLNIDNLIDQMIDSGAIPPAIWVFASTGHGPFVDAECSDSKDGREWFDRYVGQTLVPWVDQTFRTIPESAARTVMGPSKGGYCAASVLTHHPDLFGQAISLSGYFVAGLASSDTIGDADVFGNDPAYEARQSPMTRVATIAAAIRQNLFMVMEADPKSDPFGTQMAAFSRVLAANGVPQALFQTPLGHAWGGYRAALPGALQLVAARQVLLGVFGG
jgi:enterochelin esterase-like enzyme